MTPKRGQPPKAPEDKRSKLSVHLSPNEREDLEEARDIEAPDRRIGAYIRDVAVDHARKTISKK